MVVSWRGDRRRGRILSVSPDEGALHPVESQAIKVPRCSFLEFQLDFCDRHSAVARLDLSQIQNSLDLAQAFALIITCHVSKASFYPCRQCLLEVASTYRFRQELTCLFGEGIELELIVIEGYFPFGPLQESGFGIVVSLERLFAFGAIVPDAQRQAFGMQGSIGCIEIAVFKIGCRSLRTIILGAKGRGEDRFKNVRITGKTQFDFDGFFTAVQRFS